MTATLSVRPHTRRKPIDPHEDIKRRMTLLLILYVMEMEIAKIVREDVGRQDNAN